MLHVKVLISAIVVFSCNMEILASCLNRVSLDSSLFKNSTLWEHSVYETSVISPYQCADICLRDSRCKSFLFKHKRKSDDFNICEIKDIKWDDNVDVGTVTELVGTDLYNVGFEDLHKVSVVSSYYARYVKLQFTIII